MARRPYTPESSLKLYEAHLEKTRSITEATRHFYRGHAKIALNMLVAGGREWRPWLVQKEDVVWLIEEIRRKELAVATLRNYISGLTSLTLFYDNNVISKMRIRYPHDARPNVKWISDEKARELASLRTDPMTDLIVHCELCLGMRRVEVLRLTPESFLGDRVRIQGKGPVGGKTRFMPYHPSTSDILATYNNHRRSVIDQAKGRSHFVEVPPDLLIYYRYGRLRAYDQVKATAINNRVAAVGKKVGIENLANHMMRRTFGRTMWRDGVKIETISAMLGHDSIEQTLEYIGANIDDMQSAMQIFSLR